MKRILVIGCGFAGAVCARRLAESGFKVLMIERRDHIAGNMYDEVDANGVLVHRYGPHIFHTNIEEAFEFIKPYSEWFDYEHKVLGMVDGQLVPVPFNFRSLDLILPKKAEMLKKKLKDYYGDAEKVSIKELLSCSDADINELGEIVFEKIFSKYTAKQWGIPVEQVDDSVINRVPVILGYDDRYFQDKIQKTPTKGFSYLFNNILEHKNIEVFMATDANKHVRLDESNFKVYFKDKIWESPVIYTGAIDELFSFRYGDLPYRSLDLAFEELKIDFFQPVAVVNYTTSEDFTRITEFKYLTKQNISGKTTILREYPREYVHNNDQEPYYPVINDDNGRLYEKYKRYADQFKNIYFCGRLADYSYYNMDLVIKRALEVSERILNDKAPN